VILLAASALTAYRNVMHLAVRGASELEGDHDVGGLTQWPAGPGSGNGLFTGTTGEWRWRR